jgi:hypothetical protein
MTAPLPANSDETSGQKMPWEQILMDVGNDSSNDDVEDLAYQHDLRLIDGVTGHPDHLDVFDDLSKFDRQRLDEFQSVIDELHPADQRLPSATNHPDVRPLESSRPSQQRRPQSRVPRLFAVAAGVAIAIGVGIWGLYQSTNSKTMTAGTETKQEGPTPRDVVDIPKHPSEIPPVEISRDSLASTRLADAVQTERTSTNSQVAAYSRRAGLRNQGDHETVGSMLAMRDISGTTDEQREAAIEQVERSLQVLEQKADKTIAELVTLGNWHLFHRRPKTATRHFLAAIKRSPDLEEGWIGAALAYVETLSKNDAAQLKVDLNQWVIARLDGNKADAKARLHAIRGQLEPFLPRQGM